MDDSIIASTRESYENFMNTVDRIAEKYGNVPEHKDDVLDLYRMEIRTNNGLVESYKHEGPEIWCNVKDEDDPASDSDGYVTEEEFVPGEEVQDENSWGEASSTFPTHTEKVQRWTRVVPEDILLKVHDLVKSEKGQKHRQQKKSFEPLKTKQSTHNLRSHDAPVLKHAAKRRRVQLTPLADVSASSRNSRQVSSTDISGKLSPPCTDNFSDSLVNKTVYSYRGSRHQHAGRDQESDGAKGTSFSGDYSSKYYSDRLTGSSKYYSGRPAESSKYYSDRLTGSFKYDSGREMPWEISHQDTGDSLAHRKLNYDRKSPNRRSTKLFESEASRGKRADNTNLSLSSSFTGRELDVSELSYDSSSDSSLSGCGLEYARLLNSKEATFTNQNIAMLPRKGDRVQSDNPHRSRRSLSRTNTPRYVSSHTPPRGRLTQTPSPVRTSRGIHTQTSSCTRMPQHRSSQTSSPVRVPRYKLTQISSTIMPQHTLTLSPTKAPHRSARQSLSHTRTPRHGSSQTPPRGRLTQTPQRSARQSLSHTRTPRHGSSQTPPRGRLTQTPSPVRTSRGIHTQVSSPVGTPQRSSKQSLSRTRTPQRSSSQMSSPVRVPRYKLTQTSFTIMPQHTLTLSPTKTLQRSARQSLSHTRTPRHDSSHTPPRGRLAQTPSPVRTSRGIHTQVSSPVGTPQRSSKQSLSRTRTPQRSSSQTSSPVGVPRYKLTQLSSTIIPQHTLTLSPTRTPQRSARQSLSHTRTPRHDSSRTPPRGRLTQTPQRSARQSLSHTRTPRHDSSHTPPRGRLTQTPQRSASQSLSCTRTPRHDSSHTPPRGRLTQTPQRSARQSLSCTRRPRSDLPQSPLDASFKAEIAMLRSQSASSLQLGSILTAAGSTASKDHYERVNNALELQNRQNLEALRNFQLLSPSSSTRSRGRRPRL